jgi:segregation and condensation protein B
VNVDATLRTLVHRGYVEEIGHEPTIGNPTLFGTTRTFLERTGIDTLDDLPPLADFIPDAHIVEALERGLRVDVPAANDAALTDEAPVAD